ncbi:MAG: M48 family metalloprotease [Desulfovibrio sp.]|nr:M48 family metalloprotease [Desulfovibrio sp.]MCA1987360.1 M48 family metalloprotease [Desulfovibrio sp.]
MNILRTLLFTCLLAVLICTLAWGPGQGPGWSVGTPQAEAFLGLGEFGIKDEKELGDKFNVLVRSRLPLIEDPEITGYVGDMIDRLKAAMPPQPFEITHGVINHSALNAFAAPAGYIFVYSGLLLNMENESEVAGVMAHELAHVSQRHIARRIEAMGATSLLTLLGILAGVFIGGRQGQGLVVGSAAAQQAALLSYSRDNEQEADQVGLGYLINAGYPPQGLHKAFEKLQKNQWLGGTGNAIPTYLSTHPGLSERIGYVSQNIERLPANIRNRKDDNTRFRRIQTLTRARYTDPKVAITYFQRQESPEPCLDTLGRGIVFTRMNRFNDAEAAFLDGLRCSGDDPLFLREYGRLKFQQGDFQAAASLFQRALAKNRNDLMAHFFLGRIMGDTGRIEQAMESFKRILQQLPEDPEVHEAYGRALGQAGRYFDAHMHLAWAAFFLQNDKRTDFHAKKAEELARSPEQKRELERFKQKQKERKELLRPSLF